MKGDQTIWGPESMHLILYNICLAAGQVKYDWIVKGLVLMNQQKDEPKLCGKYKLMNQINVIPRMGIWQKNFVAVAYGVSEQRHPWLNAETVRCSSDADDGALELTSPDFKGHFWYLIKSVSFNQIVQVLQDRWTDHNFTQNIQVTYF